MRWATCAVATLMGAAQLSGQATSNLLRDAQQSFLILELDRARALAGQSLAGHGPDSLTAPEQADALMLLGTIAVLQDREPDAEQQFRALILLAPTYAPDTLTTPSGPLQAFQRAREDVKATLLEAPGPQLGVGRERPFRARVLVSSLHDVVVVVLDAVGDTADVLWAGPIRANETVSWVPRSGVASSYTLVSGTRVAGVMLREVRVRLDVTPQPQDTLPWPAAPVFQAVGMAAPGRPLRPLAIGAALGAAVLLAPTVAGTEVGAPARWVVAGGLTVGGVLGFVRARRGSINASAVAANATAQAAYEREQRRVSTENTRRRAATRVDVRAGPPTRRERGGR